MSPGDFIAQCKDRIFSVDENSFEGLAMEIFRFQAEFNPVYQEYIRLLGLEPLRINSIDNIPFMPIGFFKSHKILTGTQEAVIKFESSGTTGMIPSTHFVGYPNIYEQSILETFRRNFGEPEDWTFLCLLPSYAERQHSSLIYMMDYLMQKSGKSDNGYYLYNHDDLAEMLNHTNGKTMLIGVSFALLDFCEQHKIPLSPDVSVMETGGMKGRKKEIIREELHTLLKDAFGVPAIASEYGMTELLSQAYAYADGRFSAPPWMKVLIREANDPFAYVETGQPGGVNVIDLANIASCSFIATQDMGRKLNENDFEISGRFDFSDMRGCSLMTA